MYWRLKNPGTRQDGHIQNPHLDSGWLQEDKVEGSLDYIVSLRSAQATCDFLKKKKEKTKGKK